MRVVVAVLVAAVWWPVPPAAADQDDQRLDTLFSRLEETPDLAEGQAIERLIWHIWLQNGDEEVDGKMALGLVAMSRSDYPTALGAFGTVVDLAPNFAEGWNKRATVFYLMGDLARSVGDIEHTLALEPRHFGALSGLGLIFLALDEDGAALEAFEKALSIHPHMPAIKERVRKLRARLGGKEI